MTSIIDNLHDRIYTMIYSNKNQDLNDLRVLSDSNTGFSYICSIIDFNELFMPV